MIIVNHEQLLEHGNAAGRDVVLDVLETALAAPDPYHNVRKMVRIQNGRLFVGDPDL